MGLPALDSRTGETGKLFLCAKTTSTGAIRRVGAKTIRKTAGSEELGVEKGLCGVRGGVVGCCFQEPDAAKRRRVAEARGRNDKVHLLPSELILIPSFSRQLWCGTGTALGWLGRAGWLISRRSLVALLMRGTKTSCGVQVIHVPKVPFPSFPLRAMDLPVLLPLLLPFPLRPLFHLCINCRKRKVIDE